MKKRFALALATGIIAAATLGGIASAHVHGITPMNGCNVDNPNSGALGVNGTPADDANGGPIIGLIPRDVGNAPLTGGDGGSDAATGHCP